MFREAISVSNAVKELFFEVAEKDGWFQQKRLEGIQEGIREGKFENSKAIAKKMLLRGRPIEEIIEDTGLPYETVNSLM
jgi:predicted transposase YdaD